MKLKSIFEGPPPYEVEENLPNMSVGTTISSDSLYRSYNRIGGIEDFETVVDADLDIYLSKDLSACLAVTKPTVTKDERNTIIVRIAFKDTSSLKLPKDLDTVKTLQVSFISTPKAFEGSGIASALYKFLVKKHNYIVFSDDVQYRGGKMLWKKIARDTIADGLTVRIVNTETSEYISDLKGQPVKYNGNNLQDWDIWCSKNEFHNQPLLLVLTQK